jgi:hypothetical protein
MAELQFAASLEETAQIIESILSCGDVYAIEESRTVPRPEDAERFRSVRKDHLIRWNSQISARLYFFGDYSLFAPHFWFAKDGRTCWPASQGGPYIGFKFVLPRAGRALANDGDLYTESFYMIPEEHRVPGGSTSLTKEQLAPMREAYKDFVKRAKRILVRHTLKGSDIKVWIGRESLQRVEAGELCLSWGDRHYSAGTWREGRWPPDVLAIMQAE